jgi:hypothetical protein
MWAHSPLSNLSVPLEELDFPLYYFDSPYQVPVVQRYLTYGALGYGFSPLGMLNFIPISPWTDESKPTSAWTNESIHSTAYTNEAKHSTNWTNEN